LTFEKWKNGGWGEDKRKRKKKKVKKEKEKKMYKTQEKRAHKKKKLERNFGRRRCVPGEKGGGGAGI
jgi:hypothetical protein